MTKLPEALKEIAPDPRWVVWKWEKRRNKHGEVKPTKPPLMIKHHRPCGYAHNDKPATWSSLTDVMQAAQYADGVGLQLLGLSGFAALDLDDVRDEAGVLIPWADDLIRRAQSYAEFTPSGRGARILGRMPADHATIHTKVGHPGGGHFEVYANLTEGSGRYITVTGDRIEGAPDVLADISPIVAELLALRNRKEVDGGNEKPSASSALDFAAPPELPGWVTVYLSGNGTGDRSADFQAIVNTLRPRGWSFDDALKLFQDHPNGPGEKYADRLEQELRRSWDKAKAPGVQTVSAAGDIGEAQALVQRLAMLDATAYETERRDAAARLGWRASVLDAEVQKARPRIPDGEEDADDHGIETLEPWPDPVNGASLAEEIRDRLRAHVVFGNPYDSDAAAIWTIGTYLMDTWRLWPRLMVTSPTKGCGKSTLLEVLDAMVHRGFIASNASPAAVFRAIEAWQPTLLLDEADTWMAHNEELAGVLNSGHTRRTARVIRVTEIKGEHLPVAFSTWCAMAIAGIGSQRDTLMSRSIVIGLRRRLPEEPVERLPFDLHQQLIRVRRQIARWAADNATRLGAMEAEPPECGDDRRRDNWTPLHRIAAALGGPWPDRISTAYAALAQTEDDDAEPAGVMLLRDIAEMFATSNTDRIASQVIVGDLVMMEDRPWADWRHGKTITTQGVAKLMKPFGVKSHVVKIAGSSARAYLRSEVETAAARYSLSPKRNPVTSKQNQSITGFSKRNAEEKVTPQAPDNTLKNKQGYTVTPVTPSMADPDAYDPDAWR